MKKIDEILKDDHVVEVIQKGIDGAAFNVKINYRMGMNSLGIFIY